MVNLLNQVQKFFSYEKPILLLIDISPFSEVELQISVHEVSLLVVLRSSHLPKQMKGKTFFAFPSMIIHNIMAFLP